MADETKRIENLKAMGLTVVGTYEREGGGTVVIVVCTACGHVRSPDHQCAYCQLRDYEQKFKKLRLAIETARGGIAEAELIMTR